MTIFQPISFSLNAEGQVKPLQQRNLENVFQSEPSSLLAGHKLGREMAANRKL